MAYLTRAYLSRSDFKPVEFLAALGDLPSAHAADIHPRDNEPHCPLAANAMVLRFWNRYRHSALSCSSCSYVIPSWVFRSFGFNLLYALDLQRFSDETKVVGYCSLYNFLGMVPVCLKSSGHGFGSVFSDEDGQIFRRGNSNSDWVGLRSRLRVIKARPRKFRCQTSQAC